MNGKKMVKIYYDKDIPLGYPMFDRGEWNIPSLSCLRQLSFLLTSGQDIIALKTAPGMINFPSNWIIPSLGNQDQLLEEVKQNLNLDIHINPNDMTLPEEVLFLLDFLSPTGYLLLIHV